MRINANFMSLFAFIMFFGAVFGCAQNDKSIVQSGKPTVITAEALKKKIDGPMDGILLDVRTPGEVSNGILPGAMVIDYQSKSFKEEVAKLDKDKTYYVYCHAGGRSPKAAEIMRQLGFKSVIDYPGGFQEWSNKGYTLVKY